MFTIDDLWRIMKYLKDGTTDPDLSDLTTTLATSEKERTITFFEQILDQPSFNTEDYRRLREMFIDLYSSHKTIATTQKYVSDVHQLPNNHLSELFKSFGFPIGLELVPLTAKSNFFLDLVSFYKKKGTPETLVDVLDYYGFSDTDLIEYWLQKDEYGTLIFRGESVRLAATGSTILLETDVPFNRIVGNDPHWFQTEAQIENLLLTNNINLPSKTPYFSLSSIFSLYNINISLSILFRIVKDQYDRVMLGNELPYNVPVKNLGLILPILHIYVGTIYAFEKMFGYGSSTTFTNYSCYNGTIDYLGDPPIAYNLSEITSIYEDLITRPISKLDRETRIEQVLTDWTRPLSQNFLNSINAAGPLLTTLNPNFKAVIDSWFAIGDENYLITYLIGTLDYWIRKNIDSKSPSLVITMLGLSFREELSKIINFFKPYRARLAYMDTAYSLKNPLMESIILDEDVETGIQTNIHNHIRPPGGYCQAISLSELEDDLKTVEEMLDEWKWDFGKTFDVPPLQPNPPTEPDSLLGKGLCDLESVYDSWDVDPVEHPLGIVNPPENCDESDYLSKGGNPNLCNIEWLLEKARQYDVPKEYINFSYDSGGYYDILPYLQKCLMELIKNHPEGGMCDYIEFTIFNSFHDRVGTNLIFDRNFDTGANFDTIYSKQWYDKMEISTNPIPIDTIPISDQPISQISQNFNDSFIIRDEFIIDVSSASICSITSTVGGYPVGFDTGGIFDTLANLDVVNYTGRIIEWMNAHVLCESNVYNSELVIGHIEVLESNSHVNSLVVVDLTIGISEDLSATTLINSQIDATIFDGTFTEILSSVVEAYTSVYNTELTIGIEESLSSTVNVSVEIVSSLIRGEIQISSTVVVSSNQTNSAILATGLSEILNGNSVVSSQLISSELLVVSTVYNTRSVIIDIANNYGDLSNLALMGIRFSKLGIPVNIGVPGTDYTAYATSTLPSGSYYAWRLFYGLSPLTGNVQNWMSDNNRITNQRIICNVGNGVSFDEMLFYNYHASGNDTDKGIQKIKVYLSTDIISNVTYGQPIPNSTLIFDGFVDEHSAVNELDPQSITIGVYTGASHINTVVNSGELYFDVLSSTINVNSNVNANLVIGTIEEL